ncbi:CAP domain-containing protein [Geodermatophilus ruber]|uniref:Uncharacterized conserved protein YkwD, contains CAP (CSP/antigen 5/PR1) domain n=1 Tax=Geodermatophilus ruber TaxID=504800 RepID=A0A1I4LIL2_9ACTN|nr:CAP domain-containing protein [Geodermatophilus ruber]SFL90769.1 Uncharacterized conserved protein YkwD, contains CAP (CSP/antigen 5/PR1) domain [Geodermatophilus ruber]
MHHIPAGRPLASRLAAALGRTPRALGRAFRLRRVLPVLIAMSVLAGAALAAPVVTGGPDADAVALEAPSPSARVPSERWWSHGSDRWSSRALEHWLSHGSRSSRGGSTPSPRPETPAPAPAPGATEVPVAEEPAPAPTSPATPPPAAERPEPAPSSSAPAPTSPATPPPAPAPKPSPAAPPATPPPAPAPKPSPAAPPAPTRTAPAAPAPAPAGSSAEEQVLALVNEARAAAGCAPVVADAGLAAVARAHSADMRDRDFFSHTNPEGLSPFDRARNAGISTARAENIAYGQPDAAAVMEGWMNSSGHRRNILDCDLTRLGVGVAEGAGGPWWTQLFGA